ncbi:ATP-binding protein [Leptospira sp. GIMC2001]|uniref:ATP-binding protein n=1 Tax=Leptospira sp. GIMC2001 TaxID=1513297 RepID=UPI00234A29CC|nr:ATP-binding protein [Leptospira sp. GIMC2001]WCL48524.1 ATP-binding protein [Leptospira sp. GIMC2001]
MKIPEIPGNESERLQELLDYDILDSKPEQEFDDITEIATKLTGMPICLVSLVDKDRQWFKSHYGLDATETSRDVSFCAHSILKPNEPLIVPNSLLDERFSDNPIVTGDPFVRFYAGFPLITPKGNALGSLCLIDHKPNNINKDQIDSMLGLARQVMAQLELRKKVKELSRIQKTLKKSIVEEEKNSRAIASLLDLKSAIFDSTEYSLITIGLDGIILDFNRGAEKMLGYKRSEMVGLQTPMLFHDINEVTQVTDQLNKEFGTDIEPGLRTFTLRAEMGFAEERNWSYICKNGNRIPVNLSISCLRDSEGTSTGYLGIAKDITEQRKIEIMKAEFISTVSHELRTPLTSINGALGLLIGGVAGELPSKVQNLINVAKKNSDRLLSLINDILDFEKLESGRMDFHCEPKSISEILSINIESINPYANRFDVKIQYENLLTEDIHIFIDEKRINQVITNLLSNACKFSPAGSTVTLRLEKRVSRLLISVIDEGSGIPENFRNKLFQRFSQIDASNTRKTDGTGLGLSISKTMIDAMGGNLSYIPREECGSIFRIELPIETK